MSSKCNYVFRKCKICGEILFINKFGNKKRSKFNKERRCKECISNYMKVYFNNNKDRYRENTSKWRSKNKERDKYNRKKWIENNKDYVKEKSAQYRKEHKEELKENRKRFDNTYNGDAYKINNKSKIRYGYDIGEVTGEQYKEMMEFFNNKCAYTGEEFDNKIHRLRKTIDHIIPLSEGGKNVIWNIVPCTKSANSSKNKRSLDEWISFSEVCNLDLLNKVIEWKKYAFEKWGNESNN